MSLGWMTCTRPVSCSAHMSHADASLRETEQSKLYVFAGTRKHTCARTSAYAHTRTSTRKCILSCFRYIFLSKARYGADVCMHLVVATVVFVTVGVVAAAASAASCFQTAPLYPDPALIILVQIQSASEKITGHLQTQQTGLPPMPETDLLWPAPQTRPYTHLYPSLQRYTCTCPYTCSNSCSTRWHMPMSMGTEQYPCAQTFETGHTERRAGRQAGTVAGTVAGIQVQRRADSQAHRRAGRQIRQFR